jgi:hypothetical protein
VAETLVEQYKTRNEHGSGTQIDLEAGQESSSKVINRLTEVRYLSINEKPLLVTIN